MGPKTGMAQLPVARLPFGKIDRPARAPELVQHASAGTAINAVFGAAAISILIPALCLLVGLLIIVACQGALGIIGHEAIHTFEKWMRDRAGDHVRGP